LTREIPAETTAFIACVSYVTVIHWQTFFQYENKFRTTSSRTNFNCNWCWKARLSYN